MKYIILSIITTFGIFIKNQFILNEKNNAVEIKTYIIGETIKTKGLVTLIKINKNKLSYKVVNNNHRDYGFYINANYFTKENNPIGDVVIDGKQVSKKINGGGFFTTKNGNPKFYFNNRPNNIDCSSQTHTVLIRNGKSNNRISNQTWAKRILPRLVLGEDSFGNIIVIHSNFNGGMTVANCIKICKENNLHNALMFDGGASVEIGVKCGDINYNFQQVSDLIRKTNNVPTPSVFIVGNFKNN